jgi:hypothetical protein
MIRRIDRRSLVALAMAPVPVAARAPAVASTNLLIARGGPASGITHLDEALCLALGRVRRGRVTLVADGRGIPEAAAARPDGTTLLLTDEIGAFIRPPTRAPRPDRMRELVPVTLMFRFPRLLLAKPALGVADLAGLLRLAAQRSDAIPVLAGPTIETDGIAVALVEHSAGVRFAMVGPGVRSVRSQRPRWDLRFETVAGPWGWAPGDPPPHPIAVTTPGRVAALPTVPSFAELGHPGFEAIGWWGIFAPPGTTPETCRRIHDEISRACALPAVHDALRGFEGQAPLMPPEDFAALVVREGPRISALAPRLRSAMLG